MMRWRSWGYGSVAVTAGVLLLGACESDSGHAGTRPSARPVSVQEYGATLATALGPLDTALRGLNKARAYKGLSLHVTAVEQAAGQATAALAKVTPPSAVAGEHQRLVSALRRFGTDLGGVDSGVHGRDVCTGTAARAGLSDATTALRDATTPLFAKLPGQRLTLTLPDTGTKGMGRLANGAYVHSGDRGGRGSLNIDNGGDTDAVVTLAKGGKPAISVYVRKGKKYTVSGVNDGTYRIFFTDGSDWDRGARGFGKHCSFEKFDDTMKFDTVRTATQIRWSEWKITLQPVTGGTARTSDVDPDSFPAG